MTRAVVALAMCLSLTGCFFRTTYRNVSPTHTSTAADANAPATGGAWRSFYVYGWFPTEMLIPADEICRSHGGVMEIRTQKTLFQAIFSGVQAFFIGVDLYSPWDAEVVCVDRSLA